MKEQLTEIARTAGGRGEPIILYDRHDVMVIQVGGVVAKSHGPRTTDLAVRLRVARALPDILLAPFGPPQALGTEQASLWPAGEPVDPGDPDAAPWEEGARLLAALHAAPLAAHGPLPRQGAPARVCEVMTRLPADHPASPVVRRAFAALPDPLETVGVPRLVHGDFHLGQLVRHEDAWRLIDVDELGWGDPTWDLARPAGLFAAGVISAGVFSRFVAAYREAGGPAIPAEGDLWEALDIPAKALAIQTAARCVSHAVEENRPLDELETALID
ncbi:MAG: phosphotransferase, partial [Streptosporangiaceae bacterium]